MGFLTTIPEEVGSAVTSRALHTSRLRVWYGRNINNAYAQSPDRSAERMVSDGSSAVLHYCHWRKKANHTSLGMWGAILLHNSKFPSCQC